MLYRYLRDYTPSSPINSPLEATSYDLEPEEEIPDMQSWWGDQSSQQTNNNNSLYRRDSSPSVDAMDTSTPSTQSQGALPFPIPEIVNRRPSSIVSLNGSEQMLPSPTNITGSMPPPMIPQLARMKRKGTISK